MATMTAYATGKKGKQKGLSNMRLANDFLMKKAGHGVGLRSSISVNSPATIRLRIVFVQLQQQRWLVLNVDSAENCKKQQQHCLILLLSLAQKALDTNTRSRRARNSPVSLSMNFTLAINMKNRFSPVIKFHSYIVRHFIRRPLVQPIFFP